MHSFPSLYRITYSVPLDPNYPHHRSVIDPNYPHRHSVIDPNYPHHHSVISKNSFSHYDTFVLRFLWSLVIVRFTRPSVCRRSSIYTVRSSTRNLSRPFEILQIATDPALGVSKPKLTNPTLDVHH